MDGGFTLAIGGGGPQREPMYMNLAAPGTTEVFIDIRTGDVEKFIRENES